MLYDSNLSRSRNSSAATVVRRVRICVSTQVLSIDQSGARLQRLIFDYPRVVSAIKHVASLWPTLLEIVSQE